MKSVGIIILCSFLVLSCEKTEDYPEVPVIEYISFKVIPGDGESTVAEGILTFSVVDGDGNIGFSENFSDTIISNNQIDFIYTEYYKQDGQFIEKTGNTYYLPYFEQGVYRKSLKGTIDIYFSRTILSPDTVYYQFQVMDRDFNMSNIETTPEIIYSELLEQ